jgi:hypothetical protein
MPLMVLSTLPKPAHRTRCPLCSFNVRKLLAGAPRRIPVTSGFSKPNNCDVCKASTVSYVARVAQHAGTPVKNLVT